jgi:hypothetical protein
MIQSLTRVARLSAKHTPRLLPHVVKLTRWATTPTGGRGDICLNLHASKGERSGAGIASLFPAFCPVTRVYPGEYRFPYQLSGCVLQAVETTIRKQPFGFAGI